MAGRKKKVRAPHPKDDPTNMDVIGRPGGLARAKRLSASQRSEIAKTAANARWAIKQKRRVRIPIK